MHWSVLCWILEGDLCSSLKISLCVAVILIWTVATWVFLYSQLCHLNSWSSPGSVYTPPCIMACKLSQDSEPGKLRGFTLFVFCLSGITFLYCLMSSVLETTSFMYFIHFVGRGGEVLFPSGWKSILFCSIVARSRRPLTFYNLKFSWPVIICSPISILIFQNCGHHQASWHSLISSK